MLTLLAPLDYLTTGTARVAGAGFGALARLRGARALHPVGTVIGATVLRNGLAPAVGVPWIDEPGEDVALVRFSRALGLPAPLPDVLGMAIRVPGPRGEPQDLLLASTGLPPGLRHVLQPRTGVYDGGYTSVLPFLTPSGALMIGALPAGDGFDLATATPTGPWRAFGRLLPDPDTDEADHTAETDDTDPADGYAVRDEAGPVRLRPVPDDAEPDDLAPDDPALNFDPVRNPVPGLRLPEAVARLRAVAYAASRRGRGSS